MSPLQKSEYNKLLPLHYAPHANELSREGYYASAGTCRYIFYTFHIVSLFVYTVISGDSGGPLYVKGKVGKDGREGNIVTGIVSGGRGDLAKCGGINNPVHYVR